LDVKFIGNGLYIIEKLVNVLWLPESGKRQILSNSLLTSEIKSLERVCVTLSVSTAISPKHIGLEGTPEMNTKALYSLGTPRLFISRKGL